MNRKDWRFGQWFPVLLLPDFLACSFDCLSWQAFWLSACFYGKRYCGRLRSLRVSEPPGLVPGNFCLKPKKRNSQPCPLLLPVSPMLALELFSLCVRQADELKESCKRQIQRTSPVLFLPGLGGRYCWTAQRPGWAGKVLCRALGFTPQTVACLLAASQFFFGMGMREKRPYHLHPPV